MREEVLHQFWNAKYLHSIPLKTTDNSSLFIASFGALNVLQGPDFTDVELELGEHRFMGSIEIHVKSSDWYVHKHHLDPLYNEVLLHVVWQHDKDVATQSGRILPTLELSHFFEENDLLKMQIQKILFDTPYPCATEIDDSYKDRILQQLELAQHLELHKQTEEVFSLALPLQFDWERVFFIRLMSYAVDPQNRASMAVLARMIPLNIIRRNTIESYLPWILREAGIWDATPNAFRKNYEFLFQKSPIRSFPQWDISLKWRYRNLRPSSYPLLRLLQVLNWVDLQKGYFDGLLNLSNFEVINQIFTFKPGILFSELPHWNRAQRSKLFQNVCLPIWNARRLYLGKKSDVTLLQELVHGPFEENRISLKVQKILKVGRMNQFQSFSLMAQNRNFCAEKRCSTCLIGRHLWIERT